MYAQEVASKSASVGLTVDKRSIGALAANTHEVAKSLRQSLSSLLGNLDPQPESNNKRPESVPSSISHAMEDTLRELDECHRFVDAIRNRLF